MSSTDRDVLERAASALARSGDAASVAYLGQLLRDPAFLARLDDLSTLKTFHLGQVMSALAEHPTPPIVELGVAPLSESRGSLSVVSRQQGYQLDLVLGKRCSKQGADNPPRYLMMVGRINRVAYIVEQSRGFE